MTSVNAIADPTQVYRNQNDVLYFGEGCTTSTGANSAAIGSTSSGGGCGEQGYGNRDTRNVSEANKAQIWSYFKSKGLSDEAVAGIMGNMDKETGGTFLPDAVNSIGCSGIVQWCSGRNDSMRAKAEAEGKDWNCLGFQLDYIWYEMTETSESKVMEPLKSSTSAGDAANIFHDYYERSDTATGENLGRDDRAEAIYSEYTGKSVSATPTSDTNSSGSSDSCPSDITSKPSGTIPAADCAELVPKFKELVASGKIKLTDASRQENDLKNCTAAPTCHNGVTPEILRLTVAAAENSAEPITLWSHNTGHDCKGGDHPVGKAVDIVCDAKTEKAKCDELYKYLYDNAAELDINDIIFDPPPDGYQAMDSGNPVPYHPTFDGAGDHTDHIHVSVK